MRLRILNLYLNIRARHVAEEISGSKEKVAQITAPSESSPDRRAPPAEPVETSRDPPLAGWRGRGGRAMLVGPA